MPLFPDVARICAHSFMAGPLSEQSVVVDLGCNHGEFARAMIERFACRVYGAEPVPALFAGLPQLPGFVPLPVAVTAADGPCRLEVPLDRCASLIESNPEVTSVEVEGLTLARFLHRAGITGGDLLKVDIEGAELDVFLGTPPEILRNFDQITVEFHDFLFAELVEKTIQAIRRLENLGFQRINFSLDNTDVLFVNAERLGLGVKDMVLTRYVTRNLRGLQRRLERTASAIGG